MHGTPVLLQAPDLHLQTHSPLLHISSWVTQVSQNQQIQMKSLLSLQAHSPLCRWRPAHSPASKLITWESFPPPLSLMPRHLINCLVLSILPPLWLSKLSALPLSMFTASRSLIELLCLHYLPPAVDLPLCCPDLKNANLTTLVLYGESSHGFTRGPIG